MALETKSLIVDWKESDSIKQAYWEERKKLDNKIADVEYQLACLREIKKKSIESLKEKA